MTEPVTQVVAAPEFEANSPKRTIHQLREDSREFVRQRDIWKTRALEAGERRRTFKADLLKIKVQMSEAKTEEQACWKEHTKFTVKTATTNASIERLETDKPDGHA